MSEMKTMAEAMSFADRDLDCEIMKKVFDVAPRKAHSPFLGYIVSDFGPVPRFSTDASAICNLISVIAEYEAKTAEPNYFKILTPVNKDEGYVAEVVWAHHDGHICVAAAKAPTMAKAICLALLESGEKYPSELIEQLDWS